VTSIPIAMNHVVITVAPSVRRRCRAATTAPPDSSADPHAASAPSVADGCSRASGPRTSPIPTRFRASAATSFPENASPSSSAAKLAANTG
jgi:hypothetical protein